jgi:TolB-like protein
MAEQVERRLAAILAADVVGYSRLMGADEGGTHARLKALRQELIDPKIAEHRGRVVKRTGDGALVEFASAVDAVRCAVEIQQVMAARNRDIAEAQRIEFRVGINLGDVIVEEGDLFGDGVNIAARLEGLAQPGGVCISDVVHQMVRARLDLAFEDLGEQRVKNIALPVRVWHWANDAPPVSSAEQFAAPLLPNKPSLAVLPFDNLSRDPEQEYFSDGLTEDLITDLSQLSALFVTSRHAVFQYKGRPAPPRQVANDLGVRYVLEGSVRRAANRVRINAQLIDATTGFHLWAQRYDRDFEDIFNLQDEIVHTIVAALDVRLTARERAGIERRYTDNLELSTCSYRRGTGIGGVRQRGPHRPARPSNGQSCSIQSSPRRMRSLPTITAPSGGTSGATTRPRSITRWNWREEASRSMTGCRSPTCSSAGSTCGARSTIKPSPKRSVASRSTRTTPRVMSVWAISWTKRDGRRKAFRSSKLQCASIRTIRSCTSSGWRTHFNRWSATMRRLPPTGGRSAAIRTSLAPICSLRPLMLCLVAWRRRRPKRRKHSGEIQAAPFGVTRNVCLIKTSLCLRA